MTPNARAFQDAVAIFAKNRTVSPGTPQELKTVRYTVEADIYLGKGQRLDADNCGKQICDSLQNCGVIHSDAFVAESVMRIHKDDRENPRTEFLIKRLTK